MKRADWKAQPVEARRTHPEELPVNESTYTNWGCRCAGCRRAWAEYTERRKREREGELLAGIRAATPAGHPLGKPYNESTYTNWGCRCEKCTADHTEKARMRRVGA